MRVFWTRYRAVEHGQVAAVIRTGGRVLERPAVTLPRKLSARLEMWWLPLVASAPSPVRVALDYAPTWRFRPPRDPRDRARERGVAAQ